MIRSTRSDIVAHLQRHELSYSTDPSNNYRKYTRARVRNEVLPLLEELNPNIVEQLCRIADEAVSLRLQDEDGSTPTSLGRQQREALSRAITLRKLGFELPVAMGLRLILQKDNAN
jgi:tRNA(Ile)-lysidine synthase